MTGKKFKNISTNTNFNLIEIKKNTHMKNYFIATIICLFGVALHAQEDVDQPDLAQQIAELDRHNEQLNIYFNFQSSFDAIEHSMDENEFGFKARQLRFEMRGNLTDKLFYRFRHRLNRSNEAKSMDNLSRATDYMMAGYKFSDKFTIVAGKQSQSWGSFEFDLNPMNIYEYSDFIEYMDNYMLGVNFIVQPVENHEIQVQITNSRNSKMEDIYGDLSSQDIVPSNTPLSLIVNWNGNFLNSRFQTRWTYGNQKQAVDKYSNMIMLGNKINLDKFQIAFDYLRSDEDIDRLGIATMEGQDYLIANDLTVFEDVTYNSFVAKADFQPTPKWNIFAKGMYETTTVNNIEKYDDNFRTALGYFAGIEHLPFQDQDLRLFLAYIGRKYDYTDDLPHLNDYNTNRFSIGMMYRIKAY